MAEAKTKAKEVKTFEGVVVPAEGLKIGGKSPKHYKKGATFKTDNESLYQNLVKRQKLK